MSSGHPHTDEFVDAMVLAARDVKLSRRFRIRALPRLAAQAIEEGSQASLEARFHLVDGRCGVAGVVTATLRVTCQRCLQPADLVLEDQFHVVLVQSEEEMNELPDVQDSVIVNAARLDLAWMTEEQLLLAMPLAPMHAAVEECGGVTTERPATSPEVSGPAAGAGMTGAEKQTPFAQLRELMKKQ